MKGLDIKKIANSTWFLLDHKGRKIATITCYNELPEPFTLLYPGIELERNTFPDIISAIDKAEDIYIQKWLQKP